MSGRDGVVPELAGGHRPVDTSMLFFDLVFIFAVTCLSGVILAEPGLRGLLHAGILLTIVYWLWAGATVHVSMQDMSTDVGRLWVLALSLVSLALAIAIPQAFGSRGLLLALAYWGGRSLITRHVGRAHGLRTPYHVSTLLTGPLLVLGALLPAAPWREIAWATAALVEVGSLWLLRGALAGWRYDSEHLVERFGALILIALGESLVAIGEPLVESAGIGPAQYGVLAASSALVMGLWWAYFHHGDRFVMARLEQVERTADVVRSLLAYGHLVLVAGIILVAVGLHSSVEEPTAPLALGPSLLLGAGVALFLGEFAYIRFHAFRALYRSRAAGALAALVLGALGPQMPALAQLAALGAVVVLMDVWEAVDLRSAGGPSMEEFAA